MATFKLDKDNLPAFSEEELSRLTALSDRDKRLAAEADPDARPLNAQQIEALKLSRLVIATRQSVKLSQKAFAALYKIPLGTLRDLEQGRRAGDSITRNYFQLIASDPEKVAREVGRK